MKYVLVLVCYIVLSTPSFAQTTTNITHTPASKITTTSQGNILQKILIETTPSTKTDFAVTFANTSNTATHYYLASTSSWVEFETSHFVEGYRGMIDGIDATEFTVPANSNHAHFFQTAAILHTGNYVTTLNFFYSFKQHSTTCYKL